MPGDDFVDFAVSIKAQLHTEVSQLKASVGLADDTDPLNSSSRFLQSLRAIETSASRERGLLPVAADYDTAQGRTGRETEYTTEHEQQANASSARRSLAGHERSQQHVPLSTEKGRFPSLTKMDTSEQMAAKVLATGISPDAQVSIHAPWHVLCRSTARGRCFPVLWPCNAHNVSRQ
jgi:hypothetical protein